MPQIAKKRVTNEVMQPIAVQIDYADWLKIESLLSQHKPIKNKTEISLWQNQWCELGKKIDKAWKSEKSAVEILGEMRR
jgi:hypothetical protein